MSNPLDARTRRTAIVRARDFGVDLTLLEAALRLSPAERLARLDESMSAVAELRSGMLEARLALQTGTNQ